MSENVYLGIDLGSSRTSITSSTGLRETVWSYVGYAQDHVAKKKLGGRDVVFGKEAVDNRMAVHLVRPLAEGTFKMVGEDSDAGFAVHCRAEGARGGGGRPRRRQGRPQPGDEGTLTTRSCGTN